MSRHSNQHPNHGAPDEAGRTHGADPVPVPTQAAATPPEPPVSAPAAAAPEAPPPPAEDREKTELKDRLLRLQADFENYRRRVARDAAEVSVRANQDLVTELLSVLDHLDLALRAAEQHRGDEALVKGFQMVGAQLRTVLSGFGLEPFDAEGQPFDPTRHEAVSHLPSAGTPADTVLVQTRRGYLYGGRLLRPAQVVVSRGEPAAGDGKPAT